MANGYIFVNIPEKCENCFCARRYSDESLGPDGIVCRTFYFCAARFSNTKDKDIDECSIDLTGSKPDWCPIRKSNDDLISRDEALFRIRLLRSLFIGRDNQIILDASELQTKLCGREWNDEVKNELIKKVKSGSFNDPSQLDDKKDGE